MQDKSNHENNEKISDEYNVNDMKGNKRRSSLSSIQKNIFHTQLILIITLAIFLGGAGTLINIQFETQKRDQNLQNMEH